MCSIYQLLHSGKCIRTPMAILGPTLCGCPVWESQPIKKKSCPVLDTSTKMTLHNATHCNALVQVKGSWILAVLRFWAPRAATKLATSKHHARTPHRTLL